MIKIDLKSEQEHILNVYYDQKKLSENLKRLKDLKNEDPDLYRLFKTFLENDSFIDEIEDIFRNKKKNKEKVKRILEEELKNETRDEKNEVITTVNAITRCPIQNRLVILEKLVLKVFENEILEKEKDKEDKKEDKKEEEKTQTLDKLFKGNEEEKKERVKKYTNDKANFRKVGMIVDYVMKKHLNEFIKSHNIERLSDEVNFYVNNIHVRSQIDYIFEMNKKRIGIDFKTVNLHTRENVENVKKYMYNSLKNDNFVFNLISLKEVLVYLYVLNLDYVFIFYIAHDDEDKIFRPAIFYIKRSKETDEISKSIILESFSLDTNYNFKFCKKFCDMKRVCPIRNYFNSKDKEFEKVLDDIINIDDLIFNNKIEISVKTFDIFMKKHFYTIYEENKEKIDCWEINHNDDIIIFDFDSDELIDILTPINSQNVISCI